MALPEPEGSDAGDSPDANILEIFVIDGESYTRMGKEGQAGSSPEQIDALARILYYPTGPGLWLRILPKDSLHAAGDETKGGFQTSRFLVEGSLEEGTIRGTIWPEEESDALIGAEFAVSASLFSPPDTGRTGTVTIALNIEKADVPVITLP